MSAGAGAGARVRLDGKSAVRLVAGFALGLAFWFAFSSPYERVLAAAGELVTRTLERPSVTSLSAEGGEIRVDRSDFPPASPRPGLPAADIHFDFVLLAALFALAPRPLRGEHLARFGIAAAGLFLVHVLALVFQVESVYALRLGPWSEAHYGRFERNFWAGGFHFYQIAGRFAAPFFLWWLVERPEIAAGRDRSRRRREKK